MLVFFVFRLIKKKSKENNKIKTEIGNESVDFEGVRRVQSKLSKLKKMDLQFNSKLEIDHTLFLKIVSEINKLETNLSDISFKSPSYKQLEKIIRREKDYLYINGYFMQDLLGKLYYEEMKVIVQNEVPSEVLEKGTKVISKVYIPQLDYLGETIQKAEVEISFGY